MKIEIGKAKNRRLERRWIADASDDTASHVSRPLNALESLKSRLLAEQLASATDAELRRRLRRAADESASLAWTTPFPLLALPELLAEKGREAHRQFERQCAIQTRSQLTLSLAA